MNVYENVDAFLKKHYSLPLQNAIDRPQASHTTIL